jgi:dTMP kinase
MSRGLFITFEGMDGSGKTTQLRLLVERLRAAGCDVVEAVEPGGTRIGSHIRRILLDSANRDLSPTAELLLYFASRAQNVDEVIQPALAAGKIVISDRFTDSSLVYQGYGRGLGPEVVLSLDRIACRGLVPDLTVFVDINASTSLERARARNAVAESDENRFETEAADFHERVRRAYDQLAARESRFRRIDGNRDIDAIAADVWETVSGLLEARHV